MFVRRMTVLISALAATVVLASCSAPLPWPESPLYELPDPGLPSCHPQSVQEVMEAIAGHYAHYDVVAYEEVSTRTPMRTFTVSYGSTDFVVEAGRLFQMDRFCHAEQKLNQKNVTVTFSDEAIRAIEPRVREVELRNENGRWVLIRPPTPTLLGITGDPSPPLSTDPEDPDIIDPDSDGNPGVTVRLRMGNLFEGELYITRREISRDLLTLNADGNLYGCVEDTSEQFVIGRLAGFWPSSRIRRRTPTRA